MKRSNLPIVQRLKWPLPRTVPMKKVTCLYSIINMSYLDDSWCEACSPVVMMFWILLCILFVITPLLGLLLWWTYYITVYHHQSLLTICCLLLSVPAHDYSISSAVFDLYYWLCLKQKLLVLGTYLLITTSNQVLNILQFINISSKMIDKITSIKITTKYNNYNIFNPHFFISHRTVKMVDWISFTRINVNPATFQ